MFTLSSELKVKDMGRAIVRSVRLRWWAVFPLYGGVFTYAVTIQKYHISSEYVSFRRRILTANVLMWSVEPRVTAIVYVYAFLAVKGFIGPSVLYLELALFHYKINCQQFSLLTILYNVISNT